VAEWNDGKLTVWTGTQSPFGVRRELMAQFQLPEESVHVIMPDMGSGYGGKHQRRRRDGSRHPGQGRRPAGPADWTREEELTWAYFARAR